MKLFGAPVGWPAFLFGLFFVLVGAARAMYLEFDFIDINQPFPQLRWAMMAMGVLMLFCSFAEGELNEQKKKQLSKNVEQPAASPAGDLAVSTLPLPNADLTKTLTELEASLHRLEVRASAENLTSLLHPAFEEVGRSGRHWSRDVLVGRLLEETVAIDVVGDQYRAIELQPGVALLTYRAAHRQADGSLTNHTLRSSLWLKVGAQWQMRYHQGTAAAELW